MTRPTLREQHKDLKERHESIMRAAILVVELGRAAGLSSQNEAQALLRSWGHPIHTGGGERIPQVMSSGGVRIR
jgi:hypothetical protein